MTTGHAPNASTALAGQDGRESAEPRPRARPARRRGRCVRRAVFAAALASASPLVACRPSEAEVGAAASGRQPEAPAPAPPRPSAAAEAPAPAAEAPAPSPASTAIGLEEAAALLFGDAPAAGLSRCPEALGERERIRCLVGVAFEQDPKAKDLALGLFDRVGYVAGLDRAWTMDGGYRGLIEIVPERPLGAEARHLDWLASAADDHASFFAEIGARAAASGAAVRYRHRDIALRFFRSKKKRTPTAYAEGWSVAYNLAGSLNKSRDHVRETLFHEIFHLNDADHGDWSASALGPLHARIVAKCGARTACLRPYAPHDTQVVGGTYYAFQPGNGVGEYAAELATRYYDETRRALAGRPLGKPAFKCGPPENAEAWEAIAGEFFGGIDLAPPCRPAGSAAGRPRALASP